MKHTDEEIADLALNYTPEQAMAKLTKKQAVIVSAYTGYLCCKFSDMHQAIEDKLGRPVFTHELASEETKLEIREAFKDEFMDLAPN